VRRLMVFGDHRSIEQIHSPSRLIPGQIVCRFPNSIVAQRKLFTCAVVLDADCFARASELVFRRFADCSTLASNCCVLWTDCFTEESVFVVVGAVGVFETGFEGTSEAGEAGP
jgi:hypothetical protein